MLQRIRYLVATVLVAAFAAAAGPAMASPVPGEGRGSAPGGPSHRHDQAVALPSVRVRVPGVGPSGRVELRDGAVPIEIVSQHHDALQFRLAVDVQAHGLNGRFDQGLHRLAPSGASRFLLPLASLDITPERLEGPAVLTLRVTTQRMDGSPVDGVVTPSYFVTRDRRGTVLSTGDRLRRDLGGFTLSAGEGPGTFDPQADLPKKAPGMHSICVHWQYAASDQNALETYYVNGEPMAARGVKLSVEQSGKLTTVNANRTSGCVALPLSVGTPAKVTVFAEARIGTHDNLTVQAFQDGEDTVRTWSFDLTPVNTQSHIYVPSDKISTVMAYGTFSVHRLDAEAPLPPEAVTLEFNLEEGTNSYFAGMVHIVEAQYDRKFIYGHEVGHWYEGKQGIEFNNDYSHASTIDPCRSLGSSGDINLWHVMRSTEINAAAYSEGLGHFFSTVVWNGLGDETPLFRYYKDLSTIDGYESYADYEANGNLVDMAAASDTPLGGVRAWRDGPCNAEDEARYSVELDWARFFVNYLDGNLWWDDLGAAPSFAQLIDHLRVASQEHYLPARTDNEEQADFDVYHHILNALSGLDGQQGFVSRFEKLADRYGIDL